MLPARKFAVRTQDQSSLIPSCGLSLLSVGHGVGEPTAAFQVTFPCRNRRALGFQCRRQELLVFRAASSTLVLGELDHFKSWHWWQYWLNLRCCVSLSRDFISLGHF